MSAARPTAVIVDDAAFIRQGFPALMPKLTMRGAFATAGEFAGSRVHADVVVLELQRVDKCPREVRRGLEDVRLTAQAGHRICVFTQETRPFIHAACLAAGASGVVSKASALSIAEQKFVEVARGHTVVAHELIAAFDLLPRRQQLMRLTARQQAVLHARARRLTLIDTADRLGVALPVVFAEWRAVSAAVHRYLQETPLQDAVRNLGLNADDMADTLPHA